MNRKNTLLTDPSKKQLQSFIIIWFVGFTLSIMLVTDYFNELVFKKQHLFIYLLLIYTTWKMVYIFRKYLKKKSIHSDSNRTEKI